ncbi:dihydroxy-acid dehydratase [Thetidibacter halocola]|uniref:Dihydroxy-acid dehydratase n=1 Tax=Thetidibacter halocola TaxID=2827239 RepID=A0A8J7WF72_9RHOB|nr:dihydroxy-acid dehydratase [Thetidibacter halocola]MBS0125697.1 dihydroxy-acid dehydratase [Thetidibacter halocola]
MTGLGRILGAGCLVLAGCAGVVSDSGSDSAQSGGGGLFAALAAPAAGAEGAAQDDTATRPRMPRPLARVRMARGTVVVTPPPGYCIDPITAQAQRGFAVIASCRILTGGAVATQVPPMIVTVALGPRGTAEDLPSPQALADALGEPIVSGQSGKDMVTAHLAGGGGEVLPGGDSRHWRGAFVQSGHLVGLALYAPAGSDLAGAEGGVMLDRVRASIASGSGGAAPPKAADAGSPPGLLGRLFNRQDLP